MSHLHVFDMDGTLLRGAASVELSRHLGTFERANAIEDGWRAGRIDEQGFWERMVPLWEGVSESEVDDAFAASSWIAGVREVLADIAARGERAIVISQSPQFFVRRLEGWGAFRAYGSRVGPDIPVATWRTLTGRDKVEITGAVLAELGLPEDGCVAYGDSGSDTELFAHLRHTVAVNATSALREGAAAVYDGDDLRDAYALGRALLERSAVPGGEPGRMP
jgi:phosphoserine phosphatase